MYVKKESVNEVNFLASAKFQNFTYQVDDTGIQADENGKKIKSFQIIAFIEIKAEKFIDSQNRQFYTTR